MCIRGKLKGKSGLYGAAVKKALAGGGVPNSKWEKIEGMQSRNMPIRNELARKMQQHNIGKQKGGRMYPGPPAKGTNLSKEQVVRRSG